MVVALETITSRLMVRRDAECTNRFRTEPIYIMKSIS